MKYYFLFFSLSFFLVSFQFTFADNIEPQKNEDKFLFSTDLELGKINWIEFNYSVHGMATIRIIDNDMNIELTTVDSLIIDVWSDSSPKGINLIVTETQPNSGIFEGTVFFTTDHLSDQMLTVSEGDVVTATYEDYTLPSSHSSDKLNISAETYIGDTFHNPCIDPKFYTPPRCGQPVLRIFDTFGNTISNVQVDKRVRFTTDLGNVQEYEQPIVFLVQIHNTENVVVYLQWIKHSISPGQFFSPSFSWIPTESGNYTATGFVWDSLKNANPLYPSYSIFVNARD